MSSGHSNVAVALLYETSAGAEHLREILGSIGAPVVYEALANALDRDELERSTANVIVVNLDAQNDPDLDGVYNLLDDARYRVVFNEGEVSSGLSGWDRARWMRHLAAKILGTDIDPPRPADAESIPVRVAPVELTNKDESTTERVEHADLAQKVSAMEREAVPTPSVIPNSQAPSAAALAGFDAMIDFDSLIQMPEVTPRTSATEATHQELHSTSDASFDVLDAFEIEFGKENKNLATDVSHGDMRAEDLPDIAQLDDSGSSQTDMPAPSAHSTEESAFDLDMDFDLDFDSDSAALPVASVPAAVPAPETPVTDIGLSAEWSLEDVLEGAALPPTQAALSSPADFGIEKLRAEEFLAPEGGVDVEESFDSAGGISLELIPLEEAVAPSSVERVQAENWLDPDSVTVPKAKVRKVWVLGASIGGPEAVREFLAGIPRDYPALFLLAQHLGDEFVGMMTNQLMQAVKLTVRTPTHGERVAHGDVIVVPNSHRLQIDPEGIVLLERNTGTTAFSPSIDRVLQDVADKFGAGAGAIIFSGMSSDAAVGCRYLADKGGTVYAQRPDTCVVSSMIDGVCETGVVSFLGSPQELSEKLLEAKA